MVLQKQKKKNEMVHLLHKYLLVYSISLESHKKAKRKLNLMQSLLVFYISDGICMWFVFKRFTIVETPYKKIFPRLSFNDIKTL